MWLKTWFWPQKNFFWWGVTDDFSKLNSSTLPRENLFVSWPLFYFVFNVVAVWIENLWKVYLKYFWWFDWKSMNTFSKNLLTLLKGLELSPRDQKIFSWWGEAGNIYLLFYAIDDLIVNLWDHYLKYFNFIDRFRGFTRRPGDFLLVGWGWGYLFCFPCSWWFDWKSMNTFSKIY